MFIVGVLYDHFNLFIVVGLYYHFKLLIVDGLYYHFKLLIVDGFYYHFKLFIVGGLYDHSSLDSLLDPPYPEDDLARQSAAEPGVSLTNLSHDSGSDLTIHHLSVMTQVATYLSIFSQL